MKKFKGSLAKFERLEIRLDRGEAISLPELTRRIDNYIKDCNKGENIPYYLEDEVKYEDSELIEHYQELTGATWIPAWASVESIFYDVRSINNGEWLCKVEIKYREGGRNVWR